MKKIVSILGEPDDRQFKDSNEAWQYCITGTGLGVSSYKIIWFRNDQVTGLSSYSVNHAGSSCSVHFKQLRWEDAPDQKIEIRNR